MKSHISRALGFIAVLTAPICSPAQTETQYTDAESGETRTIPLLTAEQLDELLGPIALYPDALIALILPASSMPTDLVLASRYLGAGGDTSKVDNQPWDESVRGLAHYPDVIKWMDEKLSWSIMVGDAFVAQPVDVMQSIQRLRARARAAGTLVDSTQQKVVEDEGNIRIVPAQPEVIYVPYYDPQVVYVSRPSWAWGWYPSVISYPWCYPTGIWLSYDCDWHYSRVWVVNSHWRHDWYHGHGWYKPHHYSRSHYYDNHDYGHGWSPRRGGGHPDYRRDGRDRPTHVVIRDGHRDYSDSRGPVASRPRPDGNRGGERGRDDNNNYNGGRNNPGERGSPDVRSGGGDRGRDGSYVDGRSGDRGPGGDRTSRPDNGERRGNTPGTRSGPGSQPDRRPETPRVVTNPDTPRVVAPPTTPRSPGTAPRNPGVVRSPEQGRNSTPSPSRWIDRATNPGNPPPVRAESPRSRPAPAAPRVTPPPQQERSQVVRVPVANGGSRTVVVNPPPSVERSSPPPTPRNEERTSRPGRGGGDSGGEKKSERRRSNDG